MPYVADRSGNNPAAGNNVGGAGVGLERNYSTYSVSGAGTPNATVTPAYIGQIYWDTTNKVRWQSVALTNADWRPVNESEVT